MTTARRFTLPLVVGLCIGLCAGTVIAQPPATLDIPAPRAGEAVDTARAMQLLKREAALPVLPWTAPDPATLPAGDAGNAIRYGKALLDQTSKLIGPNAPDPAKRFAGNNLNCVHCHAAGPSGLPGTKPYSMPLVNVVYEYPKLDVKSMKVITLQERVAGMIGKGPAGAIPADGPEMQAILAYLQWLGRSGKPDTRMAQTGLDDVAMPDRSANPGHGEQLYRAHCIACHQQDGTGIKTPDYARGGGYSFPPIAGNDSYDDGGHMAMVPLLTRFLHVNMPYGSSKPSPQLTVDEAYDIAAYVTHNLPRKHNPGRAKSYPAAALRPGGFVIPEQFPGDDAAYQRARLGPFIDPPALLQSAEAR
ncbi:c-type cytochrome [Ralstonia syzygii subsp. celebesensis]|uniref:Cytochrome C signal peptide protein n=2 Tax=Ralstonia syzygii subsp. celebesensis TaxID=1310168 RepID=A0A1U9VP86_9RALS|nr:MULTISPECIES: c-type cytochrome [Ralstonia solanacearum species complex]AQW32488.1 cytochrome C signal peptide protein [blood disease bacterium A2-HR MARDI]QQV58007.1 c-type cytochrome [Ralstonia syzygii subsp. celebesensis]CBJ34463.1 putative cytochrome c signal peptide protein [Ralstonia solanacearum PSI07]CCA83493.1 putative cytochrome c signal peptide protein [blood disease bacterium R229]